MNEQRQDFENADMQQNQTVAFENVCIDQFEAKPRKGRPWAFDRFNAACDMPDSEPVQA